MVDVTWSYASNSAPHSVDLIHSPNSLASKGVDIQVIVINWMALIDSATSIDRYLCSFTYCVISNGYFNANLDLQMATSYVLDDH